ncbi:MAG: hypothetical protein L6Q54_10620 [Leptospiraceae bacterium]|nr:hypothetical protein [Leptospiraceae bacterium]MCK6381681.1 hypothetical protein [Leptospiraceae bacterium]NUM40556.1 hypothetical protein [Leptospiraceae bacterium]
MNNEQLINDAHQMADIALASEEPIRARELVKFCLPNNPFLAKIASDKLDTPLFILQSMQEKDAKQFLSKLKPSVLKWLWNYEKNSSKLKDFLSEKLSAIKKLDLELAIDSEFAKEDFHQTLSQEIENGKIFFDTGLLFQTKVTCPSQLEKVISKIKVLILSPVIDFFREAEFIVIGPPNYKGEFSIQLGNTAIYQENFTLGSRGYQKFNFQYQNFKNHLPAEERNRSMILLCAVKNLLQKENLFDCVSPFLYDPNFSLTKGDLTLEIVLNRWEFFSEKLELEIQLKEIHKKFSGKGEFTLRCQSCASTIGTRTMDLRDGRVQLTYPVLGHKGPFVLCFTAEKSGRKCSAIVPSSDFKLLDITEKNTDIFQIEMDEIFIDSEFIQSDLISSENPVYYYWVTSKGCSYHPILENISGAGVFPGNFVPAMNRARRFILYNEFGLSSNPTIHFIPESSEKIKTITILNNYEPGDYELHVIGIHSGIPEYKSFEFAVSNNLKKIFPGALLPNDKVTANILLAEKNPIEILDSGKNPLPCTLHNNIRSYEMECEGSKENIFFAKLGNNGSTKTEEIKILPLENPHRVVTVESWSPVLDVNSIPDYEDRLTDDLHDIKEGQILLLKDFILKMALNLWNYENYCGEQSSSRLFALGVLNFMEYPDFSKIDSEKELFLLNKMNEYYSVSSGLFALWKDCPPNNKTTSKVIRNLSIFQNTGHPAGNLLNQSLARLKEKSIYLNSLGFFNKDFQDFENISLFALWENLWRSKKIDTNSAIWKRFLNYLFLKKNRKAVPVYVPDYWSESELDGMRFYCAMILGKDSITLKSISRKKVELSFFQKLLKTVKLADYKEFEEEIVQEMLSNPIENLQKNLSRMFYHQGGTSLFGNTPGSVAFLQGLLGLHSLLKFKDLSFEKKVIEYNFSNGLGENKDIKWTYPEETWQKNAPQKLSVTVPVQGAANAVLEVFVPSHSKIISIENGFISKDKTYAQIPLAGLTKASITLVPYLSGNAGLQARVTSMYDNNWGGSFERMVESK